MKKTASLLLLSASTLFAADGMNHSNNACPPCPDPCDPCKPCCVPKPKKCINCECYTPQFYDLQCDWGLILDLEFLYWYAKESHIPLATRAEVLTLADPAGQTALSLDYLVPTKEINMDSRWDPGFRLGVGFNSECDGWDWYLTWTWMCNERKRSASVDSPIVVDNLSEANLAEGTALLLSPWQYLNRKDASNIDAANTSVSGKWKMRFNQVDLELGRKYWLSKCFNLRPFAALRGVWTDIDFDVTSTLSQQTSTDGDINFIDSVEHNNKRWGVGIVGGIQPMWYFSPCFGIYANADFALLWGDNSTAKRSETFTGDPLPSNWTLGTNSFSTNFCGLDGMQAGLDLAIGFRFEDTYCCDRYRFTFDLGWEHHKWLNYVHRVQINNIYTDFDGNIVQKVLEANENDLDMGGLVVRVRFDF